MVRTVTATPEGASLVKGFLLHLALVHLSPRVDDPAGSAPIRLSLVASQTMGLLMVRKVVRLEPLASMPVDEVVALVAPTLQYYMTGELPSQGSAPVPEDPQ
jgi:transcriptional regulator, TetR family